MCFSLDKIFGGNVIYYLPEEAAACALKEVITIFLNWAKENVKIQWRKKYSEIYMEHRLIKLILIGQLPVWCLEDNKWSKQIRQSWAL